MRSSIKAFSRLVLIIVIIVIGINPYQIVQAQNQGSFHLRQFDMMTANSGWILLDEKLFWTSDAGQSWKQITPVITQNTAIQVVKFLDSNIGWVLLTNVGADGAFDFQLAHTNDNGQTWTMHSLQLFEPGAGASYMEKVEMDWLTNQEGWISIKQNSSSNFSISSLVTTSDGGITWHHPSLPAADQIYFSDRQIGWAVGGTTNGQLFRTRNAGADWEKVFPLDTSMDLQTTVYPPFVVNRQVLLITTTIGDVNTLNVYSLDHLDNWLPIDLVKLDVEPGIIALSVISPENFVAVIPGSKSIIRRTDDKLEVLDNQDSRSTSIVELDMVSLETGWAKSIDSACISGSLSNHEAASVSCSSTTRLLQTNNGGLTWQVMTLPNGDSSITSLAVSAQSDPTAMDNLSTSENTEVFIGQGFDRCEIPTLSQMKIWWEQSPYKAVNLYIGGASRACDNNVLVSSYLFQLYQQGWKFFPTWVGPQAPCTGYPNRISNDVATAYAQGVDQANQAVDRLAELGLTTPDKTGSVVYYDIEHYGTNTTCRNAVNSFMNGWVSQLRARGNLAGVYGSTLCNTGLSDFLTITNVPDVVWPARWYHNLGNGYYDPNASVWNLGSCIPNTAWPNHQRIRQYEGEHNETWGNLTLDIDSNVLDGVVALPYDYPFVSSIVRTDWNPTNKSSVSFTVNFSKVVTGVNTADFVLSTSGVSNAHISSTSGSGTTYTVTISTGSGDGTIRLDVIDNDSIHDSNNNPLAGLGSGNGNFTSGELYTVVKATFVDVPSSYWAWSYIDRLYAAGITGGCGENPPLYCPTATVTRDQMAVFLLRGEHGYSYVPPAATGIFQDVPTSYWAADWIEQLAAEGITTGCNINPDQYCPTMPVARDQMAIFLLRAKHGASYVPPEATGVFQDVPADYWVADWIEQLAAEGITSGCSVTPNLFCPHMPVTRDQMAVFLVRNFNLP